MRKQRLWLSSLVITSCMAHAELTPVPDSVLADVTGQAYISIDKTYHPEAATANSGKNFSYTRINLGMDIKTLTNIDRLELGRYSREGDEREGMADILANNMAFGYIYDEAYYLANPSAPQPIKGYDTNGNILKYSDGEIVPFEITNPYLEFAYDETNGQIVGVRLGMGEAKGIMSGAFQTLTGNLGVNVIDKGEGLNFEHMATDYCQGDQCGVLQNGLGMINEQFRNGAQLTARAVLLNANGERDSIRAQYLGVPNGEALYLENVDSAIVTALQVMGGFGLKNTFEAVDNGVNIINQDCQVIGVASCLPLENYQSISIGQITGTDGERYLTDKAGGMFISFSGIGDDANEAGRLEWLNDINKENPTVDDFMKVTSGFFMNIPDSNAQMNLHDMVNGTDRVRTEYINMPARQLF